MIEPITIETAGKMLAWMNDEIDEEECPDEYSLRGHLLLTMAQHAKIDKLNTQLDRYTRMSESGETLGDALDMREEIERLRSERDDLAGALKTVVDASHKQPTTKYGAKRWPR